MSSWVRFKAASSSYSVIAQTPRSGCLLLAWSVVATTLAGDAVDEADTSGHAPPP
jgi:hypothetical protein